MFRLPALDAAAVGLDELLGGGPTLLVFAESDCPTCALTLRRLGAAGARVTTVFEDPLPVAARTARRLGLDGHVLSEPPPYATSRAYGVETVPTTVLLDGE